MSEYVKYIKCSLHILENIYRNVARKVPNRREF